MVNFDKVLAGLGKSGLSTGLLGGLAGGTLTAAVSSKKGRKTAKSLLQIGGVAAVGTLAWKAYQTYRNQNTTSLPKESAWDQVHDQRFDVTSRDVEDYGFNSLLLVRAMIAAAMADGHLDPGEQQRIFAQVEHLGLSHAEKGLLLDEMHHPVSLQELASQAQDPALRAEVYAASLLAIDRTAPGANRYLISLARTLEIPRDLVMALDMETNSQLTPTRDHKAAVA